MSSKSDEGMSESKFERGLLEDPEPLLDKLHLETPPAQWIKLSQVHDCDLLFLGLGAHREITHVIAVELKGEKSKDSCVKAVAQLARNFAPVCETLKEKPSATGPKLIAIACGSWPNGLKEARNSVASEILENLGASLRLFLHDGDTASLREEGTPRPARTGKRATPDDQHKHFFIWDGDRWTHSLERPKGDKTCAVTVKEEVGERSLHLVASAWPTLRDQVLTMPARGEGGEASARAFRACLERLRKEEICGAPASETLGMRWRLSWEIDPSRRAQAWRKFRDALENVGLRLPQ